ncbi:GntR family transcriptional regulator [Micromonospora rosaria]|uniref:GntR family transcriptional regulator n=2 Tax=Micromonospora TaxID=1873 RepID=A0A136PRX7_9ACTN|nr:GntR family transcriptional regulator [Micromonospora rosaria]KXK61203.1 GntR family transcriptional regulator [Micromonospora rosaria]
MTDSLELPALGARRSVRGEVANALRAALVAGQMRPGEVYSAPTLAARFGVSATPVREAMLDLVKEGLVETVRNKGFRVTELSEQELDNLTEIRRLLEVPTTVQVIDVITAEDLARLRPMAQRIVDVAEARDLIAYIEHDRQFHLELLALIGNSHLVSLVGELRARSRLFGLTRLAEAGELMPSAREHIEMLDLIEAGDRSGLERLMRAHIGHVRGRWAGRAEHPEP